jgi:hypothetical protein
MMNVARKNNHAIDGRLLMNRSANNVDARGSSEVATHSAPHLSSFDLVNQELVARVKTKPVVSFVEIGAAS